MMRPQAEYTGAANKGKTFAPTRFKAEDSRAAYLVDEAVKYLSVRQDKPWFVYLSFLSPHPPYIAPEPFHNQYDADDMSAPVRRETLEKEAAQHPWLDHYLPSQRGDSYTVGANPRDNISLSDLELRQIKATYYGMMSEIDSQIGRLIDYLKQTGAYENTLIVFTSDHGDMQGDHWMLSKSCYFDQAFHVPMIVRDPGATADRTRGTKVEAFTESVDIMPTILAWAGLDIPAQCDGYSLLPFCHGEQPKTWRQEYHAEFDLRSPYSYGEKTPLGLEKRQCMVGITRGERYKYVHFAGLPSLFFDLEKDPDEFIDRFKDPDYQQRVLEYAEKTLTWRMEHDEPALTDLHLG
jgi:arylsulfatase A-like enzyme